MSMVYVEYRGSQVNIGSGYGLVEQMNTGSGYGMLQQDVSWQDVSRSWPWSMSLYGITGEY